MSTQSSNIEDDKVGAFRGILRTYDEHQDLLILAMTGRTGSGCTTAADLLTQPYRPGLAEHFAPGGPEATKHEICRNHAQKVWTSFTKITVSALLLTFMADETDSAMEGLNGT